MHWRLSATWWTLGHTLRTGRPQSAVWSLASDDGGELLPTTPTTPPVGYDRLSVIDLTTMSESHNHDQEHVVSNRVDDAVATHPYPETRSTPQRPGGRRPWVVGKESNRSLNARTNVRVELT